MAIQGFLANTLFRREFSDLLSITGHPYLCYLRFLVHFSIFTGKTSPPNSCLSPACSMLSNQ